MIKVGTAKRYLESSELQVSMEAASALAFFLDEEARTVAQRAIVRVQEENRCRELQGLEPRRRLTAQDIREAGGI